MDQTVVYRAHAFPPFSRRHRAGKYGRQKHDERSLQLRVYILQYLTGFEPIYHVIQPFLVDAHPFKFIVEATNADLGEIKIGIDNIASH